MRVDAPAKDAAAILGRHDVRAVLVVDEADAFLGVISDRELLRALLPPYVDQPSILARVLEETAADVLFRRLEGRSVADLMPPDRQIQPVVQGDDTLVEVASVIIRARISAVGVVEDGRLMAASRSTTC